MSNYFYIYIIKKFINNNNIIDNMNINNCKFNQSMYTITI